MKDIVLKNKKKLLIILVCVLSLSSVVAFAKVSSTDKQDIKEDETKVLGAAFFKSQEDKEETEDETDSVESLSDIDKAIYNQEIQVSITKEEKLKAVNKKSEEITSHQKAKKENAAIELEEAVKNLEEKAKIVPLKYESSNFPNIGTVSSKDVALAVSTASEFVNIRETTTEDSKVMGKLYKDQVAAVISIEGDWVQIESGSVKGYITSKYLNLDLSKDDVIEQYGNLKAASTVNGLNVRQENNEESKVLTVIYENEKYSVSEVTDEWIKISIPKEELTGYIASDYAKLSVSFKQAISIEEEQEKIRIQKEKEEAERLAAKKKAEEKAAQEAKRKKAKKEAAKKTKTKSTSNISEQQAKERIAKRESGGNYNARNGRYIGRYQLSKDMLKGDYSPENQERAADRYVAQRYGSWKKALEHSNAHGWY